MSRNMDTATLLEKYFDVAFAAPDGIKKLRELILSLAMQGKLVPQDEADQPASELLKEIAAEKSRLVKDGKIKASKPLSEIKPDEVPYDLPNGWEWVRLGDLGEAQTGATPSTKDIENFGDFIPFIGPGDIKNYKIDYSGQGLSEIGVNKGRLIQKNSILMVCIGGSIGKHAINDRDLTCNQQINTITPYNYEFTKYIFFAMGEKFFQTMVINQSSGSATPIINKQKWSSILTPLPPLAEQRRIVAKIDELMVRCDELEKLKNERNQKQITLHKSALNRLLTAKDHSDFQTSWHFITQHFGELYSVKENVAELRKAILQLAVMGKLVPQDPSDQPASELLKEIEKEKQKLIKEGKIKDSRPLPEIKSNEIPYDLPKGWEWVRLQEVLDVRDGTHDSPKDAIEGERYPLITSKNFTNGKIDFSNARQISAKDYFEISKRSKVDRLDILFSMIGGNIGNQVLVQDECEFSIKNVALFKYYNRELTYPYFFKRYMEQIAIYLQQKATGGAQPFVSLGFLRNLVMALPPITEQHRIVAKIDQLMTLCDELEKQIDAADSKQTNLLNSMMAKV